MRYPNVDSSAGKCIAAIKSMGYKTSACPFCGALTPSDSPTAFCVSCESYVDFGHVEQPEGLATKLPRLYKDAVAGNAEKLDALAAEKSKLDLPPQSMYGIGMLYHHAASERYHGRDYARKGFMEENSGNVYASLALTSRSKEFMYKALYAIDSKGGAASSDEAYTRFIINIRLGRMDHAMRALGMIPAARPRMVSYSWVVYSVSSRSKGAMDYIRPMEEAGEPNVFYYLARHMAQRKRFGDAVAVLRELTSKWSMPLAVHLLSGLKGFIQETSM